MIIPRHTIFLLLDFVRLCTTNPSNAGTSRRQQTLTLPKELGHLLRWQLSTVRSCWGSSFGRVTAVLVFFRHNYGVEKLQNAAAGVDPSQLCLANLPDGELMWDVIATAAPHKHSVDSSALFEKILLRVLCIERHTDVGASRLL